MSQIGAWLKNLRKQERQSYRLARAFFVQKPKVRLKPDRLLG